MLYQIFYNEKTQSHVKKIDGLVTPIGVHDARKCERIPGYIYDDELSQNLTEYNTLCEWRVLYYVWQNLPSPWVGFTSWQHDRKGFLPTLGELTATRIEAELSTRPLWPFMVLPLDRLMLPFSPPLAPTLKNQFIQWNLAEAASGAEVSDIRQMPMGKYHHPRYWDAILAAVKKRHGLDLDRMFDWEKLGATLSLHTWCHAFVSTWDFFDAYMQFSAPIVVELLQQFGNHPTDLELSYSCERLLILFNYSIATVGKE